MAIGKQAGLNKLVSNTSIISKASKKSIKKKENKATEDTIKMTFYVKKDLLAGLRNFAYWERLNITEAFNRVVKDGLKGKNTKDK